MFDISLIRDRDGKGLKAHNADADAFLRYVFARIPQDVDVDLGTIVRLARKRGFQVNDGRR